MNYVVNVTFVVDAADAGHALAAVDAFTEYATEEEEIMFVMIDEVRPEEPNE